MIDYELTLFDRVSAIRDTIKRHGEDNFYISFSGGKDSTALSALIDIALPDNKIPRVFINTGVEYRAIINYVKSLKLRDERIIIIEPITPVKRILDKEGYPFKSKEHSTKLAEYQKGHFSISTIKYMDYKNRFACPKILVEQFSPDYPLKVSSKCCKYLKKDIALKWVKENKKTIAITGMRSEEGGQRRNIKGCILTDNKGRVIKFHPLIKCDSEFIDEFINKNNVTLCSLYYEPFNFKRTGCKCCPYSVDIERQLLTLRDYDYKEYLQALALWAPVYKEYVRLNYRIKSEVIKNDLQRY